MSLVKFKLTEKHIALARNLDYGVLMNNDTESNLFGDGADDMWDTVGLIVFGQPKDFDPTTSEGITYTKKQKDEMEKLMDELPQAIQIMMMTGKFEVGNYATKHYDINWKKKK